MDDEDRLTDSQTSVDGWQREFSNNEEFSKVSMWKIMQLWELKLVTVWMRSYARWWDLTVRILTLSA